MKSLLYYITGHGFGHAVRSSLVIEQLLSVHAELMVHVRTSAPARLFPAAVTYSRQSLDVGVVQPDSLTMDIAETLRQCQRFYMSSEALIQTELAYVREHNIAAIAADIPPLAFEIAARAEIPSIAITNFTWNEIYRSYLDRYSDFQPLIDRIETNYAKATLALTLPYPCDMAVFPRQRPIAWIARRSLTARETIRRQLELAQHAIVILLSFGGLGLERISRSRLKQWRDFQFLCTGSAATRDANITTVADGKYAYEDLIQAVDVIVTKPGYGIVADALAHRTPVLYTDRGEFPEYPRLVAALHELATAEHIPQSELLAGSIGLYLNRLLAREPNWPAPRLDGAAMAAREICALLNIA